jgi:hypothetical protein
LPTASPGPTFELSSGSPTSYSSTGPIGTIVAGRPEPSPSATRHAEMGHEPSPPGVDTSIIVAVGVAGAAVLLLVLVVAFLLPRDSREPWVCSRCLSVNPGTARCYSCGGVRPRDAGTIRSPDDN